MRNIKIRNFGPIKNGYEHSNGFILIDKVTVFIGTQASGKSSIVKLISTLSWIEKALYRNKINEEDITQGDRFRMEYCAFQGIENYFYANTEIAYQGFFYEIFYEKGTLRVNPIANGYSSVPKITFIPAERNFVSVVEKPESAKGLPLMLSEFLEEYIKAQRELSQSIEMPINNIKFEFQNKISYIIGNDYKLRLTKASSGLQSVIPLFLVIRNHILSLEKDNSKREPSLEEKEKLNKELEKIRNNPEYSDLVKDRLIMTISIKYKNSFLINILEEIEQNLFPESQRNLLNKLLEYTNSNDRNELILTTHSPYIISYLTIARKGGSLLYPIEKHPNQIKLKKELEKVIPIGSCVTYPIQIYELDGKGNILFLEEQNGIIPDNNYLNNSLSQTNTYFDRLLEIEESL